jgi:DMSO/TMAO reductase YedYZ molybdopterin-dependent catalytic subunit
VRGPVIFRLEGAVEVPLALTYGDLRALPEGDQVRDVSRFHPGRKGDGVTLESLLSRAQPTADAVYLTLHAGKDDFHVSVPLDAVRGEALVVFRLGETPLGPEQGGPVRFLIRNPAACHTDELDDCANVKYLDRIELSRERGPDTRPANESAHAALPEGQKPKE